MKLVLMEDILSVKDLPRSIDQIKTLLKNKQIAFKSAYADLKKFIEKLVKKKAIVPDKLRGDVEYTLSEIDDLISALTNAETGEIIITDEFANKFKELLKDLTSEIKMLDDSLLERVNNLLKKKDILAKLRSKFDKEDINNFNRVFREITKGLNSKDKEYLYSKFQDWENELSRIDMVADANSYSENREKYDKPFETAQTDQERREIITSFLKDEDFWGNIGYYDLAELGSPFITELLYKGFNSEDNAFIPFVKDILPNRDIKENKYRIIHNLYVKGFINDLELRNKEASKVARALRYKELYKLDPDAMDRYIRKLSGKDEKRTGVVPWQDNIDKIDIKKDNYKTVMSIINDEYNPSSDNKQSTAIKYGLPKFYKEDRDKWMSKLARLDISGQNFRQVLDHINRRFAESV